MLGLMSVAELVLGVELAAGDVAEEAEEATLEAEDATLEMEEATEEEDAADEEDRAEEDDAADEDAGAVLEAAEVEGVDVGMGTASVVVKDGEAGLRCSISTKLSKKSHEIH